MAHDDPRQRELDQDHDGGYASREEATEAIRDLTDTDVKKLMIVAKFWFGWFPVRPGHGGPDDLLQEAILRTLDGRRRWRQSVVSIVKHLDRSMESIASKTPKIASKDRRAERTAHVLDEPHARRAETSSGGRRIAKDRIRSRLHSVSAYGVPA